MSKTSENHKHHANLHFISGGKIMETILSDKPYGICRAKKNTLNKTSNYKYGKLVVVSVHAHNQLNE